MKTWVAVLTLSAAAGVSALVLGEPAGLSKERAVKVLSDLGAEEAAWRQAADSLSARLLASPGDVEDAVRLVVLRLNFEKAYGLDKMRSVLWDALKAGEPTPEAIDLWLGLNPGGDELGNMAELLEGKDAAPGREVIALRLAMTELRRGKTDAARAVITRLQESPEAPIRSQATLLSAIAFFLDKKDDEGTAEYDGVLDGLDPSCEEWLRSQTLLIARDSEREEYDVVPPERKAEFYRSFWKKRDTFPLTEANERLASHYRRLFKALDEYALRTNGNGYFTDRERFDRFSPKLDYYDPGAVWDAFHTQDWWLSPKGLVFVRHGKPDRSIRSTSVSNVDTWVYAEASEQLYLLNFVRRPMVGEDVLVAHLAIAATGRGGVAEDMTAPSSNTSSRLNVADDPEEVAYGVGSNAETVRQLYRVRTGFIEIYTRLANATGRNELQELLGYEGQAVGPMITGAVKTDDQDAVPKNRRIPLTGLLVNFKGDGSTVDSHFFYAVPVDKVKREANLTSLNFDAVQILYTRKWDREVRRQANHHQDVGAAPPPGKDKPKDRLAIGRMEFNGLEPATYQFVFQITENTTQKFADIKGDFGTGYYEPGYVALSDIVPAERIEPASPSDTGYVRLGYRINPVPTRVLSKSKPGKLYFEIYNLARNTEGSTDYDIKYQILTLQKKPHALEKILGIGMNVAQLFFPFEVFLGQVGMLGIEVASRDEKKGLKTQVGPGRAPGDEDVVSEIYTLDTSKMAQGYYSIYVTATDKVNGTLATASQGIIIGK